MNHGSKFGDAIKDVQKADLSARNQYVEIKVEEQQRKRERAAQSKTVGPRLKGGRDAPVVKRRWKACAGNRQLGR